MKSAQTKWLLGCIFATTLSLTAHAQDWTRFRGPNGSGISETETAPPTTWDDNKNMKWKAELPGPGHSCPIVVGDKVFVTCWTGYGVEEGATQEDLRLHLLCYNRNNGEQVWGKAVEPTLPEETYAKGNMFAEHGFATHTPVSDGNHVWAFFGKSGVVCFDLEGNEKWRKNLGKQLDPKRWGSSSSPILYKDILIVTASVESNTLFGLNKETGEEVWSVPADGFASTWGTPVLSKVSEDRTDLVIAVPYELWGFDPETGKFRWFCESLETNSACASAIADGDKIYFVESGRGGGGTIAIEAGGKDDITKTNVRWKIGERNRIGTPVLFENKLFWVGNNMANCISAEDGSVVYEARLDRPKQSAAPTGISGGGGRRGGGMRGEYSSPVAAAGNLYYVSRKGEVYVIEMGTEFKQLAVNTLTDGGEFSASPAISNGELFVRSTKMLYCIANQ